MKKVANAPSTPATTTSIAMMPMFIAIAIGESLWPKQTGHASAARGAASKPSVNRLYAYRFARRKPSRYRNCLRLPLKRRAVDDQPAAAASDSAAVTA